jgi:ABC-type dipeptide/oligopeptide/nickel transport system ATPase component
VSEGNRSLLLVTHDLGVVAQYCRRVVVMKSGHVVESGAVADVFTSPEHPYTKQLLAAVPPAPWSSAAKEVTGA